MYIVAISRRKFKSNLNWSIVLSNPIDLWGRALSILNIGMKLSHELSNEVGQVSLIYLNGTVRLVEKPIPSSLFQDRKNFTDRNTTGFFHFLCSYFVSYANKIAIFITKISRHPFHPPIEDPLGNWIRPENSSLSPLRSKRRIIAVDFYLYILHI